MIPEINSTGNQIFIRFLVAPSSPSMVEQTARGFKANYTAVCGGRLTADAQPKFLQTAGANRMGPSFINACQWTIVAERPGTLTLFYNIIADILSFP